MSNTNKTFKAIVAFTFHSNVNDSNTIRSKFETFIEEKNNVANMKNVEPQDESTYSIQECDVKELIKNIVDFCNKQLTEESYNYNKEDFIRVFYAENGCILMEEINPSGVNPKYSPEAQRFNEIINR